MVPLRHCTGEERVKESSVWGGDMQWSFVQTKKAWSAPEVS